MKKILIVMGALTLLTAADTAAPAQDKKEAQKPPTSTIDAWRTAMPTAEQPALNPTPVTAEEPDTGTESAAEIEKKILELEKRMIEALKQRDSVTLKSLLADDFMLAGLDIAGVKSDKIRFIDWAVKSLELKTYNLGKMTVRVFPAAAVVTYNYKRQASIGGVPSDGDYVATDVWIKRGNQWLAVSHHISQSPKP